MISVAFAVDAGYVPWCAAAIRSLLDHHDAGEVDLHVVHDGTVAGPLGARLTSWLAGLGGTATLHAVPPARSAGLPSLDRFGTVVWSRFLLPELLPEHDRVLYLDADVVVTGRLDELFATDLGGAPLGAVRNVVERSQRERLRRLGIADPLDVCNSGVLLLDLPAMRAAGTADAVLDLARDRAGDLGWPDQDALNLAVGSWARLHPRWNAQNSLWDWRPLAVEVFGVDAVDEATSDPAIVHFEGPSLCKPWHLLCEHPWRDTWWDAARRTPFAPDQPEDVTVATRLISRLSGDRRRSAYLRLLRLRQRSAARRPTTEEGAADVTQPPVTSSASAVELDRIAECRPFTMASDERLLATIDAVRHVVGRGVPGALVECGVWRGGSVLAMVRTLQELGVDDRDVWCFDTFTGMTAPGDADVSRYSPPATETWADASARGERPWGGYFDAGVFGRDQVAELLAGTGYPVERIHLVAGPVEDTIPADAPDDIALLRLDTDWYESTRHELEHLYPRLRSGGVLIVDDYGHWEGAARATDEYFASGEVPRPLLARTDYTGRMGVKG
ncbi:MAG: TylF/MycF/NovP-related O-methyltransferase [Acidimicrobiia bacterium]